MSKSLGSYFDPLSLAVIVLTMVLFVIALFVNGFTHDLLQECGVFLVFGEADHDESQERHFGEARGRTIGEYPEPASDQQRT